jgi:hypothetical protein
MVFPHFGIPSLLISGLLFAAMPSSTSYQLNNYGFGSGGTSNSTSSNYKLNGTSGETSNVQSTSTNYKVRSGNNNSQQAYVPAAPTFTNPSNYYNKLKFVLTPGASPIDTKFSIVVSTDNFVTKQYVQIDDTLGATKTYQTYAAWGGGSGQQIVGLSPTTTYAMAANAIQGDFTETEFGPAASAATVAPSITFDIDVSAIDQKTSAPYNVTFASLYPGNVITSNEKIWVDVSTNAVSGAGVYVSSQYGGLRSASKSYTIPSASADLSVASSGFGAQSTSATQVSGGPITVASPYNGAGQNVGIMNPTVRQIYVSAVPVTSGRLSFQLKAKSSNTTPSTNDYAEAITLTVAGLF